MGESVWSDHSLDPLLCWHEIKLLVRKQRNQNKAKHFIFTLDLDFGKLLSCTYCTVNAQKVL